MSKIKDTAKTQETINKIQDKIIQLMAENTKNKIYAKNIKNHSKNN